MTEPSSPYAALDDVEDRLMAAASRGAAPEVAPQAAQALGDAWVDQLGARWVGEAVTGFPRLGRARAKPTAEVSTLLRLRSPGRLRDIAEAWDVAYREQRLAWLLGHQEEVLTTLRQVVQDATGASPDDDEAFMEGLQSVLASLLSSDAPREERRRVREQAVLFLGKRLQDQVGGEWTVCADPKDVHLGAFTIDGWSPIGEVRTVGPARPPGFLGQVVQLEHDARQPK